MNGNGTMGTREVAEHLNVNMKTLQSWVRSEVINPVSTGEGRQRRLEWSPDDVEKARQLRDRHDQESPLLAAMGPELIAATKEARRMKDFQSDGDCIVAAPHGGRIFALDTPLSDVLRRMRGEFFILMR